MLFMLLTMAKIFSTKYFFIWINLPVVFAALDVTTIYREVNANDNNTSDHKIIAECHARTNALGFPFLIPSTGFESWSWSVREPHVNVEVPSCHLGAKLKCPWHPDGWAIVGGASDFHLPPVPIPSEILVLESHSLGGLSELVTFNHMHVYFRVMTAVRGTARLVLLSEADPETSSLYILDVVHNHPYLKHETSSLLKCPRARPGMILGPPYFQSVNIASGLPPRFCTALGNVLINWTNEKEIEFRLDIKPDLIELRTSGNESAPLISQKDFSMFEINYLAVASENLTRNWTFILEPQVWIVIQNSGSLISRPIEFKSNKLCISFFAHFAKRSASRLLVLARMLTNSTTRLLAKIESPYNDPLAKLDSIKKWQLYRIISDVNYLDEVNITITKLELIIRAEVDKNHLYNVAIHSIMGCNPYDEEEISLIEVSHDINFLCDMNAKSDLLNYESPNNLPIVLRKKQKCAQCFNGGICSMETKTCICPAGFIGPRCEEGCGANSYGQDCEGRCSGHIHGCRGMNLCVPQVGCLCAPGYGGSKCLEDCEESWYGANCLQKCGNCEQTITCDKYTGVCNEGCQLGFRPPLCNETYSYLITAPNVSATINSALHIEFSLVSNNIIGGGQPEFYQIQYKWANSSALEWQREPPEGLQLMGEVTRYDVTGLVPGRLYRIRVILIDRDGGSFDDEKRVPSVVALTLCQVPFYPKYSIHTSWVEKHTFEVEWQYDPNLESACELVHFRLYLKEGWRVFEYARTNQARVRISNRSPTLEHWVQVEAITTRGPAVPSKFVAISKEPGVPSAVRNVSFINDHPRQLEIIWEYPRFTGGKIEHFVVKYKCLRYLACPNLSCSNSSGQLVSSFSLAHLYGLEAHAQYEIRVAAYTNDAGPWTRVTAITRAEEPAAAPEPASRPILGRTHDSLTVDWMPIRDCRLWRGYLIGYKYRLFSEGLPVTNGQGNVRRPPLILTGLQPFKDYMIYVHQINSGDLGDADLSLAIAVKTRGLVAPEVQDLKILNVAPTWAEIEWKPPSKIDQFDIKLYNISVKCLEHLGCNDTLRECSKSGGGGISEGNHTVIKKTYQLSGLHPYSLYEIKVAAFTGETGMFATLLLRTPIDAPVVSPAPDEHSIPSRGSHWVLVQWRKPNSCAGMNGPLTGYRYRVTDTKGRFEHQGSLTECFLNITSLEPHTKYLMEINVLNGYIHPFDSKHALVMTVWTRPLAPGAPQDLRVYRSASDKLGLRWKLPNGSANYPHGPLDSATITYMNDRGARSSQRVRPVTPCLAFPNWLCHDLENLHQDMFYNITVKIWNSMTYEESPPAFILGYTREEVSDSPSTINLLNRNSTHINIEWTQPERPGYLKYFRVVAEYWTGNEPTSLAFKLPAYPERPIYKYDVGPLRPSTQFTIKICGISMDDLEGREGILSNVFTAPENPRGTKLPQVIADSIKPGTVNLTLFSATITSVPVSAYFVVLTLNDSKGDLFESNIGEFTSSIIKNELKELIGQESYIAMEIIELDLEDALNVTLGNGELVLGEYGSFVNRPLLKSRRYIPGLVLMAEYQDMRSYSFLQGAPFNSWPEINYLPENKTENNSKNILRIK